MSSTPETLPTDEVGWPGCPQCGRRRLTTCPYCKTSRSDFAPSTGPDRRSAPGQIVICAICDEPFEPMYLQACEWCGHEFADGVQVKPPVVVEPIEINERMLLAIVGMAAAVGGVIAYFAWVLR